MKPSAVAGKASLCFGASCGSQRPKTVCGDLKFASFAGRLRLEPRPRRLRRCPSRRSLRGRSYFFLVVFFDVFLDDFLAAFFAIGACHLLSYARVYESEKYESTLFCRS